MPAVAKAICSIDGCEKPRVGRGWCINHWMRWKDHSDPTGGGPSHIGKAMDWPDGTRTCTKCDERKPLDQFDKVKGATLGRRSNCKACRSSQMRERYATNREVIKARADQFRKDNAELYRERDRARNRLPHRKELSAERTAIRRARLKAAAVDPGVTRSNLRRQYGDQCFYCGVTMQFIRRRSGDPFPPDLATLDHVHPVSLGGSHTWDNVVLACWSCNCSKKHSPLVEWLERRLALN